MAEVAERSLEIKGPALEYLGWCLQGGPTLSEALLGHLDFRRGRLTALLPENLPLATALDFRGGGLDIRIEAAIDYLAARIHGFLKANGHRLCILQDYVRSPSEDLQRAWQELRGCRGEVRFWPYDSEVYYLLFPDDTHERIADTIRFADSISPFIGVMTSLPAGEPMKIKQKRELSEKGLRQFVERAEQVFFNAYDQESYLIWTKD